MSHLDPKLWQDKINLYLKEFDPKLSLIKSEIIDKVDEGIYWFIEDLCAMVDLNVDLLSVKLGHQCYYSNDPKKDVIFDLNEFIEDHEIDHLLKLKIILENSLKRINKEIGHLA